jgi:Family of unknown function (DUF6328)
MFAQISELARGVDCVALMLMALAIGLLIAPSMRHRIVEAGADTNEVYRAAGLFASAALVPLGASLGLDVYVVFEQVYGPSVAAMVGGIFFGLAGLPVSTRCLPRRGLSFPVPRRCSAFSWS